MTPVLLLSLVLCGVSAWINLEVAPHCRVVYKNLIERMKVQVVSIGLPEGRVIRDFKGYEIFVQKADGNAKISMDSWLCVAIPTTR